MTAESFFQTTKLRFILCIVLFTLTTIIPTLGYSGFMFKELVGMDPLILYAISIAGSTLALFITNFKRAIPNLISGVLLGAGVCFVSILYLEQRSSIIKAELIIPILLGAIPAMVVYHFMTRGEQKSKQA